MISPNHEYLNGGSAARKMSGAFAPPTYSSARLLALMVAYSPAQIQTHDHTAVREGFSSLHSCSVTQQVEMQSGP